MVFANVRWKSNRKGETTDAQSSNPAFDSRRVPKQNDNVPSATAAENHRRGTENRNPLQQQSFDFSESEGGIVSGSESGHVTTFEEEYNLSSLDPELQQQQQQRSSKPTHQTPPRRQQQQQQERQSTKLQRAGSYDDYDNNDDHDDDDDGTTNDRPWPSSDSYAGRTTLSDNGIYDDILADVHVNDDDDDYDVGSLIGDYALPGKVKASDRSIEGDDNDCRRHLPNPTSQGGEPQDPNRDRERRRRRRGDGDGEPSSPPRHSRTSSRGPVIVVDQVPSSFRGSGGGGAGGGSSLGGGHRNPNGGAGYGSSYDEIFSQFGLTTGSQNHAKNTTTTTTPMEVRQPPNNRTRQQQQSPARTNQTDFSEDEEEEEEYLEQPRRSRKNKSKNRRRNSFGSATNQDDLYSSYHYGSVLTRKVCWNCRLDLLIIIGLVIVVIAMGAAVLATLLNNDPAPPPVIVNGNTTTTSEPSPTAPSAPVASPTTMRLEAPSPSPTSNPTDVDFTD